MTITAAKSKHLLIINLSSQYHNTLEQSLIKVHIKLFLKATKITKYCGSVIEWLTRRTSNLRIASCMGSNPVRDSSFLQQGTKKLLYTHCSVLICSRNGLDSVSIS